MKQSFSSELCTKHKSRIHCWILRISAIVSVLLHVLPEFIGLLISLSKSYLYRENSINTQTQTFFNNDLSILAAVILGCFLFFRRHYKQVKAVTLSVMSLLIFLYLTVEESHFQKNRYTFDIITIVRKNVFLMLN